MKPKSISPIFRKRKKDKDVEKRNGSNFVPCPLNCGTHVPFYKINHHLDMCCPNNQSEEGKTMKKTSFCDSLVAEVDDDGGDKRKRLDDLVTSSREDDYPIKGEAGLRTKKARTEEKIRKEQGSNIPTDESTNTKPDAFQRMIESSQNLNRKVVVTERFHLDDQKRLSWISGDDLTPTQWSGCVIINETKQMMPTERAERAELKLIVSSSIQSFEGEHMPKRLVMNHSKLSVPVLKSILQKSIRRRRPLPAVRVAMELIDKSWNDLIRRMPIIILEDSTLHPDFPLLVWLMVASSKGFIPPLSMITRVLQIVFEVASCPWKDYLTKEDSPTHMPSPHLTLFSCGEDKSLHTECRLMLRCFILRKRFGGMACDLKMLDCFFQEWKSRYESESVPQEVGDRLLSRMSKDYHRILWKNVPQMIHLKVRNQSSHLISQMISGESHFNSLSMKDITAAGIDFHCSNILDSLVNDPCIVGVVRKELYQRGHSEEDLMNTSNEEQVKDLLKSWMWKFSSGINHRQPLIKEGSLDGKRKTPSSTRTLWKIEVLPQINSYANKYISTRLHKYKG